MIATFGFFATASVSSCILLEVTTAAVLHHFLQDGQRPIIQYNGQLLVPRMQT
jgi:hypothetical protein